MMAMIEPFLKFYVFKYCGTWHLDFRCFDGERYLADSHGAYTDHVAAWEIASMLSKEFEDNHFILSGYNNVPV